MIQGMNRIAYGKISPETNRALFALEQEVRKTELDRALVNLVYLRVSQINGCAYCVDMHTHDLAKGGETPERLALLVVWREAPHFTKKERAALAWAEAVTKLGEHGVPDAVYEEAKAEFGDKGLVDLNLAVATINTWNRFGIAFQLVPASHEAAK
jgi:AhpD family alkylhydroperoxidase